ncbi:MAG: S-adenosyl-L-methionine-dependent methyltransferase [Benniella sp.]|nr:MAG: S-adenosyl-L-methionine-dependent methyltransferase [Benniella sp.]
MPREPKAKTPNWVDGLAPFLHVRPAELYVISGTCSSGRVVGVDYTPEPLNDARAFAIQQGVTNIEFQVGDIHALNFPDNTFDIVHVHQGLQHVADPVQALREMGRVAKPGGIVAARETAIGSMYPELPSLEAS